MRLYAGIILLLLTTGLLLAQQEIVQDSISILARKELNNKIEKFRLKKWKECKAQALQDAEAHVDSLIVAQIELHLIDTITFPVKPVKPPFPDNIEVKDSIKAKPILEKTQK